MTQFPRAGFGLTKRSLAGLIALGLIALGLATGLGASLGSAQAASRFVFANESDYDTVDPHAAFDVGRVAVRLNIYDGLMRWQKQSGRARAVGRREPHHLAPTASPTRSRCARASSSTTAREVKASDVVYSLERILALGKGAASLFKTMVAPGSGQGASTTTPSSSS